MISFIYFDVGGVALRDFSGNANWQRLKKELGVTAANNAAFEQLWARYSPRLCLDRNVETLLPVLAKELSLTFPKDYSLLAGFVNRFEPNPIIWPVIKKVKQKIRVGLLTNMYPGMLAAINERDLLPDVAWDVVIDSSVEQLQKPDKKLFALAQKKAGVPAGEILFIDNSADHVRAAATCGWQTFLYDASKPGLAAKQLEDFLNDNLG